MTDIDANELRIVKKLFRIIQSKISQNMMYVRIWFLLNILRINKQNSTKFCRHIVIDKIYVGILKGPFFRNFTTEFRIRIRIVYW